MAMNRKKYWLLTATYLECSKNEKNTSRLGLYLVAKETFCRYHETVGWCHLLSLNSYLPLQNNTFHFPVSFFHPLHNHRKTHVSRRHQVIWIATILQNLHFSSEILNFRVVRISNFSYDWPGIAVSTRKRCNSGVKVVCNGIDCDINILVDEIMQVTRITEKMGVRVGRNVGFRHMKCKVGGR